MAKTTTKVVSKKAKTVPKKYDLYEVYANLEFVDDFLSLKEAKEGVLRFLREEDNFASMEIRGVRVFQVMIDINVTVEGITVEGIE